MSRARAVFLLSSLLLISGCASANDGEPGSTQSAVVLDAQGTADYVRYVTDAQYQMYLNASDAFAQSFNSPGGVNAQGYRALAEDLRGVNANYERIVVPGNLEQDLAAMIDANAAAALSFDSIGNAAPAELPNILLVQGGSFGDWVDELNSWRWAVGLYPVGSAPPAYRDEVPWANSPAADTRSGAIVTPPSPGDAAADEPQVPSRAPGLPSNDLLEKMSGPCTEEVVIEAILAYAKGEISLELAVSVTGPRSQADGVIREVLVDTAALVAADPSVLDDPYSLFGGGDWVAALCD